MGTALADVDLATLARGNWSSLDKAQRKAVEKHQGLIRQSQKQYLEHDEFDVPDTADIIERYNDLTAQGQPIADGQDLAQVIGDVRRRHRERRFENTYAALWGLVVAFVVARIFLAVGQQLAGGIAAGDTTWPTVTSMLAGVVVGSGAGLQVWAWIRRSQVRRTVASRAHADALLTRAEGAVGVGGAG